MRAPLLLLLALATLPACLTPWTSSGPWKCSEDDTCPGSYVCDDGVCCLPGGEPACPTLPLPSGGCGDGGVARVYFRDGDGDGDGNEKLSRVFCAPPTRPGWVLTGTDCDDSDRAINASSPEVCNGRDDNCNRVLDEGLPTQLPFFPDEDGDGVGVLDAGVMACMAPPGYTAVQQDDCARYDPAKHPGADELCNNLDDDCDGVPDTAEARFADADDATSRRFPCNTGAPGVCAAGTFRCVPGGGGVVRECRPLATATASREVCDGLDNDCDGATDEAPECGGPTASGATRLVGNPDLTYAAVRVSGSELLNRCQANRVGTPMTVSNTGTTWSGTAGGSEYYHVWSAQAPPGVLWDLSKLNLRLRIKFDATAVGGNATRGAWGDPSTGDGFNPVIYLCGEDDFDFIRYRITQPAAAFKLNDTAFDQVLPLNNSSSTWLVGTGSGFDTSKVKRIEVLVFSLASSFTITFDPQATGTLP
ncbi:MAG: putative metal-binding motif-containing protein [Myxococcota bacterium]